MIAENDKSNCVCFCVENGQFNCSQSFMKCMLQDLKKQRPAQSGDLANTQIHSATIGQILLHMHVILYFKLYTVGY